MLHNFELRMSRSSFFKSLIIQGIKSLLQYLDLQEIVSKEFRCLWDIIFGES